MCSPDMSMLLRLYWVQCVGTSWLVLMGAPPCSDTWATHFFRLYFLMQEARRLLSLWPLPGLNATALAVCRRWEWAAWARVQCVPQDALLIGSRPPIGASVFCALCLCPVRLSSGLLLQGVIPGPPCPSSGASSSRPLDHQHRGWWDPIGAELCFEVKLELFLIYV
jgi:hypothetical protein